MKIRPNLYPSVDDTNSLSPLLINHAFKDIIKINLNLPRRSNNYPLSYDPY